MRIEQLAMVWLSSYAAFCSAFLLHGCMDNIMLTMHVGMYYYNIIIYVIIVGPFLGLSIVKYFQCMSEVSDTFSIQRPHNGISGYYTLVSLKLTTS